MRRYFCSALVALIGTWSVAVEIEFTSVEGYSAGQLAANSEWGGHSYFLVNPDMPGMVTLDGSTIGYKTAFHKTGLSSNDTYTVGIRFSFNRSATAPESVKNVIAVQFLEVASVFGGRLDMQLQRVNWDGEKYRLGFYEDTGSANTLVTSDLFDEDDLGFESADDSESDGLWLNMTLTRGADASSWTASGMISNITDGVLIMEFDTGTFDTSSAYFTDKLYPAINTVNLESQSFTSNRVVDSIRFSAETDSGSGLDWIDFTEAEGYSSGQLVANPDWGGGSYFLVDPSGSGTVTLDGSLGWQKVFRKTGLSSNDTYTVGMQFSFNRSTNAPDAVKNVIAVNFLEVASVTGGRLDMQLQRVTGQAYRLGFFEDTGNADTLVTSGTFDEDDMGFDSDDDSESDSLWLSMTLTRGADASSWTASGMISNVTDCVSIMEFDTGTFDTSSAYFTDELYPAINSAHIESQSFTSGRVVDAFAVSLQPEISLTVHSLFHDHMVLQRGMAVPVWGTAAPGSTVIVSLDGETVGVAVTDEDGCWQADLAAQEHDGGVLHVLRVESDGQESVEIDDVVIGDVFIAAGQSNMGVLMNTNLAGYVEALAQAGNYSLIRQVHIAQLGASVEQEDPDYTMLWTCCNPTSLKYFSAVGFFFARNIYEETGVPIGLLLAAWGSQKIERFLSPDGVAAVPELSGLMQNQEQGGVTNLYDIYNAMIAPLAPYGIKGAIWYQGEANSAEGYIYKNKMQALMRGWRQKWAQGDFPFYYVQLANYASLNDWAALREAQTAALSETNTGMAVAIDIGEDDRIHPRNKYDVGLRLARWALAKDYGVDTACCGPNFWRSEVENSQVRILFDDVGDGLLTGYKDGTNAVVEVVGPLQNFEIAGADRSFVDAEAVVDQNCVVLSSETVTNPVYARYCYSNTPSGSNKLYNAAGLPTVPFRTDSSYALDVILGSGSQSGLLPGGQVSISASDAADGEVFDRWIGAASEVAELNIAETTVTMPDHSLYLLASYRSATDPVYTLAVSNGTGSGTSQAGSVLNIEASVADGQVFSHWVGDTQTVVNVNAGITTLRMPSNNVTLTAVFQTVDSVGDGIEDSWRATYFAGDGVTVTALSSADADPDGDGLTNEQEYYAGTSPVDSESVLRLSCGFCGSNSIFTFQTVEGRRYRLQTCDSLSSAEWSTLFYNLIGGGGQELLELNSEENPTGFYRLRLE